MIHATRTNFDEPEREPRWNDDLGRLADVLAWTHDARDTLDSLDLAFRQALVRRLENRATELHAVAPARVERLREAWLKLAADDLERALVEPETCRRLVTRLHTDAEVLDHLEASFARDETARRDHEGTIRITHSDRIAGGVPIVSQGLDEVEFALARAHVERALALVHAASPPAGRFVETVTRRLVLAANRDQDRFSSNSPQGRVGLARFTNPTHPDVDDVVLAEALVHESIHGFVGKSETIGLVGDASSRWLADDTTYDGESRTVSPWTGTPLDVPTYLHACFVWWGLVFFWAGALGRGLFDDRRVRARITRAARGFQNRALLGPLVPFEAALHPGLLRTLRSMANEIEPILEESGLGASLSPAELRA